MGNFNIVKRMLKGSNCPSSKKSYIEDVMADDYVKPILWKFAAEVCPDKRAGEPKAEILMGFPSIGII